MNIQELLRKAEEKYLRNSKLLYSVYTQKEELLNNLATALQQQGKTLPAACRFVYADCAHYESFAELIRFIGVTLLEDEKLKPDDTYVKLDEIKDEMDEIELYFQFKCLIDDMAKAGLHIALVLDHYECTPSYWHSDDYAWFREIFDSNTHISCLLLSPVFASEVTKLAVGSSPFWNIFEPVELEEEEQA